MGQDVRRYDILISCPGDIKAELVVIDSVVDRFNQQFSDDLGIMLRIRHWAKSSFSESGGNPQALLNKQFVEKCDAAVALFWTRFGTPTDQYGSGSEEEVQIMLDDGKQVFLGFSSKPIDPSMIDSDQYKALQAFKAKYTDKGIYFCYSTDEELEKTLFAHLTYYFMGKKQKDAEKRDLPKLVLAGIENEELVDHLVIKPFINQGCLESEHKLNTTKRLFDELACIELPVPYVEEKKARSKPSTPYTNALEGLANIQEFSMLSLGTPVSISGERQKIITDAAKHLGIWQEAPAGTFFLGSLKRMPTYHVGYSGDLVGSEDEKKKYKTLLQIVDTLTDYIHWHAFEAAFKDHLVAPLALTNVGSTPDEDIDLTLFFSDGQITRCNDLPILDDGTAKFIREDIGVDSLFSIPSTINYKDFVSAQTHVPVTRQTTDLSFPFGNNQSEQEMLQDELDGLFLYEYFYKSDQIVIKLHFDYIKQNTAVAFPSVLFINPFVDRIAYEIRSKKCPSVIRGELKL